MLANIILGHLVGDYILQNNWMAFHKSDATWQGWLACSVHCLVYSLAVCAFTEFDFVWFLIVFNSHLWIDHFALADKWTKFKNGKSLKDYVSEPTMCQRNDFVTASFKTIIYTVQDNTMHLVLMYWGWINFMGA